MLPKRNRADRKLVAFIFKEGRFINSPSYSFKFIKIGGKESRISVIVPKSVSKSAVKRNKLRRLGYSAIAKHPSGLAGALIFKKYQDNLEILKDEAQNIFSKINN